MSRLDVAKYSIYVVVMIDLCYYAFLDLEVAKRLPPDSNIGQVVSGFGSTIDYVAWVILIGILEIETAIVGPRGFGKTAKGFVYSISVVCYLALVYAAWTYINDYSWYFKFENRSSEKLCELADSDYDFLNEKETYVDLNAENCLPLEESRVYEHTEERTLITAEALVASKRLGLVSAANGVAWLLLLVVMQIEIMYEEGRRTGVHRPTVFLATKAALYLVLFADAVYWGMYGNLIDAWDASLWLVAFLMLDLNLFRLSEESGTSSNA